MILNTKAKYQWPGLGFCQAFLCLCVMSTLQCGPARRFHGRSMVSLDAAIAAPPKGWNARWAASEATGWRAPPDWRARLTPSGADPNLGVWVSLIQNPCLHLRVVMPGNVLLVPLIKCIPSFFNCNIKMSPPALWNSFQFFTFEHLVFCPCWNIHVPVQLPVE